MQILLVANDNDVYLNSLLDSRTKQPVNNATITYALKDTLGSTVTTGSLTYVSGTAGQYRGTIESTVAVLNETEYVLEITASQGTRNGFWKISCEGRDRLDMS